MGILQKLAPTYFRIIFALQKLGRTWDTAEDGHFASGGRRCFKEWIVQAGCWMKTLPWLHYSFQLASHRENMKSLEDKRLLFDTFRSQYSIPKQSCNLLIQTISPCDQSTWAPTWLWHWLLLEIVCFSTCVTFMTPPRLHVPRKLR